MLAIGRPGYGMHYSPMTMIEFGVMSSCGMPYAHCGIYTGGSDILAIRRPCQGVHAFNMFAITQDNGADNRLPDSYLSIFACGGNALSIGRPGYRPGYIIMATGEDMAARACIPYLHSLIIAARSNALS